MDKKDKKTLQIEYVTSTGDPEFCLNCNDMDDLAISEEASNLEQLQTRFSICRESGKFYGDFCARLFVVEDRIDNPALFADEDEVS
ncbi:MAG: hypothetical protein WC824_13300 [Bacteroidota bacterium]|jgi:hypothetical protein